MTAWTLLTGRLIFGQGIGNGKEQALFPIKDGLVHDIHCIRVYTVARRLKRRLLASVEFWWI